MQLEFLSINDITPYENNPRHNEPAIDAVAESIKQFGFKVPIVIDKDNTIVTGHTRRLAAIKLGLAEVPCIRADDLSPEQVKAFRLADNKVSELATWDLNKLDIELEDISLDMGAFGFEIESEDIEFEDDGGWYGDERERTNKAYNLPLVDYVDMTNDFWQMPIIRNDGYIPDKLTGFNYAKTLQDKRTGSHFYIDDYQFERVWNDPKTYVEILSEYDCVLSPDFSLYMDMPMPMKIWNIYRSRQMGAYWQTMGIRVIPTISWAEPETYEFCFAGIPKGSIVSISTVGVKRDQNALKVWRDGTEAMINKIEPSTILVYGGEVEFDYGGIDVRYYANQVTERWKG